MQFDRTRLAVAALCIAFALPGCQANSGGSLPAGPTAATRARYDANKTLYVTSRDENAVYGFKAGATGNVKPIVTIDGRATQLSEPFALAIDSNGKIYVVNDSDTRVLIFPAGANGNVKPKILGGSKVKITHSAGVAVDASDQIYVSDYSSNAIYVWKKGASGNVKPIRTIAGANTSLDSPEGMAFDSNGNLWVANSFSSDSLLLEFAKGANGNVAPIAAIGGSNTGLGEPYNVTIDPSDRIIARNSNHDAVVIFAAGSNGNVAPVATITGSKTKLTNVSTTGTDSKGRIYATTLIYGSPTDSILTFSANANGNVKPINDITGPKTEFREPLYPTIY